MRLKTSYMKVEGDIEEAVAKLEYFYDWDYMEREDKDYRFDFGQCSIWVRSDGIIEGNIIPSWRKKFIKEGIAQEG